MPPRPATGGGHRDAGGPTSKRPPARRAAAGPEPSLRGGKARRRAGRILVRERGQSVSATGPRSPGDRIQGSGRASLMPGRALRLRVRRAAGLRLAWYPRWPALTVTGSAEATHSDGHGRPLAGLARDRAASWPTVTRACESHLQDQHGPEHEHKYDFKLHGQLERLEFPSPTLASLTVVLQSSLYFSQ